MKLNWEWIVWNDGRKFNDQTQGNWSNYRSYVWFVTTEKEFTFLNGIRWVENQLGDFNITSRTHSDLDVCLYLTFFRDRFRLRKLSAFQSVLALLEWIDVVGTKIVMQIKVDIFLGWIEYFWQQRPELFFCCGKWRVCLFRTTGKGDTEFKETKTWCTLHETARSAQLKFSEEILLLNNTIQINLVSRGKKGEFMTVS